MQVPTGAGQRGQDAHVCTGAGRIPAAMQAPGLAVGIGAVGQGGQCTSRTEHMKPALSLFFFFFFFLFLFPLFGFTVLIRREDSV